MQVIFVGTEVVGTLPIIEPIINLDLDCELNYAIKVQLSTAHVAPVTKGFNPRGIGL